MTNNNPLILIYVFSLVAEGCPQLALQLSRRWLGLGYTVVIICLQDQPNDLASEFESLGISIYALSLGSGLLRYIRLSWDTYLLSRKLKPKAILSFPLGWHTFIALAARLAGVSRICAHVGNLPPVWTGAAFHKFKLQVQLGRIFTHRLLCCSDYIRSATIRDFAVRPVEALTIYNGFDLNDYKYHTFKKICTSEILLGMVARLEPHKDHITLIHSISILRTMGLNVSLSLIGDGSNRQKIESLINSLQLQDSISLLGTRRDIPDLLSSLDIFVFSVKPDEGFGIALAEAMAAGVPIVASDVGACREVLDDGSAGLLVPPGSSQAFADAIIDVISNPVQSLHRCMNARKRATNYFSIQAMADSYANELGIS